MKVGAYECHVTLNPEDAAQAELIGRTHKFNGSFITGDEDMGDLRLFYLTSHDATEMMITVRLENLLRDLRHANIQVLRDKVERIVRDNINPEYLKRKQNEVRQFRAKDRG